MKKLKNFLKAFIFVQLGTCVGRVLAQYIDYREHPGLYEMQSAPWYTGICVTIIVTAVIVIITSIAYYIVSTKIKCDGHSKMERKELNKKLLKRTFVSEMKSRKKENFFKILIYFISLFIAFFMTDLIVEWLQFDFWLIDMIISVVFAMIMLFIGERIVRKLKK